MLGNLAAALLARGDLDGAEQAVRTLLAADPVALDTLAAIRLERGDAAGALAVLERGLAVDPDRGSLWFNRGRALAGMGRAAETCRDWREAARHPLPPAARDDLPLLLARCGAAPGAPR